MTSAAAILLCSATGLTLPASGGPMIRGDEAIMAPKAHGTAAGAVLPRLRWNVDRELADWCCCFNRHYAEPSGYWASTAFLSEVAGAGGVDGDQPIVFADSVSGKPLFVAPRGRPLASFLRESEAHGWPSFRSEEVVWENVRVLPDGECVSTSGSHLGHNIPDGDGLRLCINLVSVAGTPRRAMSEESIREALRQR